MAHLLSEVNIDGRNIVEAMYSNQPAWHGLGGVFDADGRQAADSASAIELAHLGWRVAKEPLQLKQDGRDVSNHFALVRQDTRDTLAVVGNEYAVLQNSEAFEFLDGLMMDGVMRYETAFAIKGGRNVVMLARLPSVDYTTPDDPSLRYILWSMSHGGGAIVAKPTTVRVVCANTLNLALSHTSPSVRIRHSGNMGGKLARAKRWLATLDSQFDVQAERSREMASRYHSRSQAEAYIDTLYPHPGADASKRQRNNWSDKVSQVRDAVQSPANRLASIRGTWWALANAVSETVDHGSPTRQSRDPIARRENKFVNVTDGPGAEFKEHAFRVAYEMSA